MCDKAVNTYPSAVQFVCDRYKTQGMCDKAVGTCPFVFSSVCDCYITQEMCDKTVFKEHFMLKHCSDKYKTQKMCVKAVDSYLLTLKFVPYWFVMSKMLEKLDNSVFTNEEIFYHNVDFNIITFLANDMGFNTTDLININQDDDFDEDDSETLNHVRPMAWRNRF